VSQKTNKIEEIKNIDKISQYTRPQNSHKDQLLTTEQLIPRPMNPTNCPNKFISSEVKLLNRNRPLAYTLKEEEEEDDDDDDNSLHSSISYKYYRTSRCSDSQLNISY
jgi:hypothetical protein